MQLKWSAGVRDIWDLPPFSWLRLFFFLVSQHAPVLMFLRPPAVLWSGVTERGSQNYKRAFSYLFIYPALLPFCCFVSDVLELIEYDPLTAVWNNEASFPHIFSPRMASLSCTSVHIKVPYQCGIWGWRNYWSHWEPGPPYLLLLHRGRDGIMEAKAMLSVRRQWSDNKWGVFGLCFCYFI